MARWDKMGAPAGYLLPNDAAYRLGVCIQSLRQQLEAGVIVGAKKQFNRWMIPESTVEYLIQNPLPYHWRQLIEKKDKPSS